MKISIKRVLQLALIAACFLAPGLARAQAPASDDTYAPNQNPYGGANGASTVLIVNSTNNAYIKFNMAGFSNVTSGSQIQQATLKLFLDTAPKDGNLQICALENSVAWTESSLAGDPGTTPPCSSAVGTVSVPVAQADACPSGTGSACTYIIADVTTIVQYWLNTPGSNNGFGLVSDGTLVASFDSKENTATAHDPRLDIYLVQGVAGATGPAGPAGPAGPTGVGSKKLHSI